MSQTHRMLADASALACKGQCDQALAAIEARTPLRLKSIWREITLEGAATALTLPQSLADKRPRRKGRPEIAALIEVEKDALPPDRSHGAAIVFVLEERA